jgi:hypothetical protein
MDWTLGVVGLFSAAPLALWLIAFLRPDWLEDSWQWSLPRTILIRGITVSTGICMLVVGYSGAGNLFGWLVSYPLELDWLRTGLRVVVGAGVSGAWIVTADVYAADERARRAKQRREELERSIQGPIG